MRHFLQNPFKSYKNTNNQTENLRNPTFLHTFGLAMHFVSCHTQRKISVALSENELANLRERVISFQ